MSKIGYWRVSDKKQNESRQLKQLEEYQCTKIFGEKVSGKNIDDRLEFQKLIDYIREEDEVVVISLDRLSRKSDDIDKIFSKINEKGATLTILDFPSFRGVEDPNLRKMLNNLVLEVFKYTSQNEREKIRERQRQGIEIARKQGKFKGRKKKYFDGAQGGEGLIYERLVELLKKGESYTNISNQLRIGRSTVYRTAKKLKEEGVL